MRRVRESLFRQIARRALVATGMFLMILLLDLRLAHSAELVPAWGWMHAKDDAHALTFGNLALRSSLLPALDTEIAVGYRNERRFNDQLQVRMVPVTGSLWLRPVPSLYAGGGVGWYHTTLDYDSALPFADETREEFGVHAGGGLQVPLAPSAAVDLGGRYVMLRDQSDHLIPSRFDPDFWVTTLGLAIRF